MKAMVLAAGFGNRLRPLTDHTPKPLVSIGGKPLIVHHLEKLSAAGFKEVVINLGHLGCKIPEVLGDGSNWSLSIEYSDEGPEPLETGGGMAKALPLLGGDPFLLVNGDVWCDLDFCSIPKTLAKNDLATLYLVPCPEWRTRGDFSLSENRVIENDAPEHLYSGIAIYHPQILEGAKVERFSIVPRLKKAISQNQVAGLFYGGEWDDVGTPDRLHALQSKYGP
jgi:MurNAc alpha-1-phosphate uridylyltransferase